MSNGVFRMILVGFPAGLFISLVFSLFVIPVWKSYARLYFRRGVAWSDFTKPYGLFTIEEIIEKRQIRFRMYTQYFDPQPLGTLQPINRDEPMEVSEAQCVILATIADLKDTHKLLLHVEPMAFEDAIRVLVLRRGWARFKQYFMVWPHISAVQIDIATTGGTWVNCCSTASYAAGSGSLQTKMDLSDPRFVDKLWDFIRINNEINI